MGQAPPAEIRDALNSRPLEELVVDLAKRAPELAMTVDLRNRVRVQRALERIYSPKPSVSVQLPPFEKKKFAVVWNPDETNARIERRTKQMFDAGWPEEVKNLLSLGYSITDPGFRALGYGVISRAINGDATLDEALATTIANTKQYAKRQRTWLRSEPNLVILDSADAHGHAARELSFFC
jgi:tRNA dimethylallyltransferase